MPLTLRLVLVSHCCFVPLVVIVVNVVVVVVVAVVRVATRILGGLVIGLATCRLF